MFSQRVAGLKTSRIPHVFVLMLYHADVVRSSSNSDSDSSHFYGDGGHESGLGSAGFIGGSTGSSVGEPISSSLQGETEIADGADSNGATSSTPSFIGSRRLLILVGVVTATSAIVAVGIVLVSRRRRHQSAHSGLGVTDSGTARVGATFVSAFVASDSDGPSRGLGLTNRAVVVHESDSRQRPLASESESSLSRVWRWIWRVDSGTVTARPSGRLGQVSQIIQSSSSADSGIWVEPVRDARHRTRMPGTVVDGSYTVSGRDGRAHPGSPLGSQLYAQPHAIPVAPSESDGRLLSPTASGDVLVSGPGSLKITRRRQKGAKKTRKAVTAKAALTELDSFGQATRAVARGRSRGLSTGPAQARGPTSRMSRSGLGEVEDPKVDESGLLVAPPSAAPPVM